VAKLCYIVVKNKIEYLLVDGYNIIFSWSELKDLAQTSLESSRIKLLNIMSNYEGITNIKVIVVFDAHKVNKGIEKIEDFDNIKVVYTKEKETADNYIEKITLELSKNYIVRVATSDKIEQIIIIGKGAYRVSAKELLKTIEELKKKIREDFIDNTPIKNNLLSDNIDVKSLEFLENLRREKRV
jgi:uncharacterized protein